jgi:4-aminobutyrate aminotransferase-like enzyme
MEPIQVHGGVVIPPPDYWRMVEELCRKLGILIIDDEVFVGVGKTGKFFAIANSNVKPDIICLGKALGAGLPLGAMLSRKEITEKWQLCSGGRVGSLAGNPVSCAAALAGIETIKEEKLMSNAEKIGSYLVKGLNDLAADHEIIGDVRGQGLLIGLELVKNRTTKIPATHEAINIANKAFTKGLLLLRVGRYHNVIRITPPLTIRSEHADKTLAILDSVFKEVTGQ